MLSSDFYAGLPRISKWRLPSRNWLIFLGITGAWTSALLYDRYHKRRVQKKWAQFVSHLAEEPVPNNKMPRKITILLAAPPGDGLRPAREHFHEYIKPILVAGAIDWEVIEGRREGEVRAGLAEKLRKLRRRNGEQVSIGGASEEAEIKDLDLVRDTRQSLGISEWDGIQGDMILGRNCWKEYIQGLHEGWLGPLTPPQPISPLQEPSEPLAEQPASSSAEFPAADESQQADSQEAAPEKTEAEKPPEKPQKPPVAPPYISTTSYSTTPTASTLPEILPPSLPLQLPHLLGLKHTPTRLYRFLTRRHLADETGAQVAALVLATHARPYTSTNSFSSAADPDSPASSSLENVNNELVVAGESENWEQAHLLQDEEAGWHKSAWKATPDDERTTTKEREGETTQRQERVWIDQITIDPRIGSKMRLFELEDGARIRAEVEAEDARKKEPSLLEWARKYVGWEGKREKKGWEMGEEGDEFS